jgi:hypothetical protein
MARTADDRIEILGNPDRSGAPELHQYVCAEGFPAVQDLVQRVTSEWSEKDVDVVVHHHGGVQIVPGAIEMP